MMSTRVVAPQPSRHLERRRLRGPSYLPDYSDHMLQILDDYAANAPGISPGELGRFRAAYAAAERAHKATRGLR